jgi:hypothetical protein
VRIPKADYGRRGTLAVWVRPKVPLHEAGAKLPLVTGDILALWFARDGSSVSVYSRFGPEPEENLPYRETPYLYSSLLVHLRPGRIDVPLRINDNRLPLRAKEIRVVG